LVEAAKVAPHNPAVKHAARRLAACYRFTCNLEAFKLYEGGRYLGTVWETVYDRILQPGLDAALTALGNRR
jgi:hypothetical protein